MWATTGRHGNGPASIVDRNVAAASAVARKAEGRPVPTRQDAPTAIRHAKQPMQGRGKTRLPGIFYRKEPSAQRFRLAVRASAAAASNSASKRLRPKRVT